MFNHVVHLKPVSCCMSIISPKNGQKNCFKDCPALELVFLWANWEWKQRREEGTVGNGNGQVHTIFPWTSPFSVKSFFRRCLFFFFFFLIGRDRSHGEENGEEVEKLNSFFLGDLHLAPKRQSLLDYSWGGPRAYENHPFLCPSSYFMCISVLRGHMHAFIWSSHKVQGGQINIHIYTMAYHVLSVMSLNTKLGRDAVNQHSRTRGLRQPTEGISSW